ncbi:hypothetical protein NDA11_002224 [Ustilago hordei]|uniref:Uncharacterized protein n=1 Tax=Ustilago hordei TaxID=120017 RepID=I2FZ56_USTHO|nr:uncharacterized protein UHO2_06798 [Ustilago hordei]KAJ1036864.1 hypothetical protein NDA10_001197 [Ustilago hordei]KAJ1036865.1 hypothetical protein NDA10_000717 [Ustilago hordei]KAJ1584006.1 hypothetical protein NDA11_002224 [Ustilago hordei]KAJ1599034.1 hypothetical protein NDA14_000365 [Ustilago hordei]UTT91206.1 hypothetical protein NDA17_001926 [Ustilago hordei]
MTEEDFDDLGYTKENLFNEKDGEPLKEYMNMQSTPETNEEETPNEDMVEPIKYDSNAKTWIDDKLLALTAANTKRKRNLDPTVHEALAGEDRRHWEEAMRTELDGCQRSRA